MGILDEIVKATHERVDRLKKQFKPAYFQDSALFASPVLSLEQYLHKTGKNGIIAEFKRKSPSKGIINVHAKVSETTVGYMRSGCSALSILTEPRFFNGKNEDLIEARKFNFCPILRKDFILDPIQVYESRAIGADAVLLIARILEKTEVEELTACAQELGMEVLFEVEDAAGIEKILPQHRLVGINSRNLDRLDENADRMLALKNEIPKGKTVVAESGITTAVQVTRYAALGFDGFLVGTRFMQHSNPGRACAEFCKQLQQEMQTA